MHGNVQSFRLATETLINCKLQFGQDVGIWNRKVRLILLFFFYGATFLVESWPSQQYPSI
jgi:hypothetical protein